MSAQEKYVHSLKQIKDAEEKTQIEIENQRKKIAEEIKSFETDADMAIESAKIEGKKLVETSIEQARKKAALEVDKILEDARIKAKTTSTKIDSQMIRGIMDILLKGIE